MTAFSNLACTTSLMCLLGLAGCVTPQAVPEQAVVVSAPQGSAPSPLPVAINLVSVLVQLQGYSPYNTTIQSNSPGSVFGEHLLEVLELAGYGIQPVRDNQGSNFLSYSASVAETQRGTETNFDVQLGQLSISRSMMTENGHYVPSSPVTIRGVPVEAIAMNGSLFVARTDQPLSYTSGIQFVGDDGASLSDTVFRYAYWPTGDAQGDTNTAELEPARFLRQATARLYERSRSVQALGNLPEDSFTPQKQLSIRFPGGSNTLIGAANRAGLETLVSFHEVTTDRITIYACSPEGVRTDATVARSARVKAELLTLGLEGANVVEAGCPQSVSAIRQLKELRVVLERVNA